jgi:hypothetical protein
VYTEDDECRSLSAVLLLSMIAVVYLFFELPAKEPPSVC